MPPRLRRGAPLAGVVLLGLALLAAGGLIHHRGDSSRGARQLAGLPGAGKAGPRPAPRRELARRQPDALLALSRLQGQRGAWEEALSLARRAAVLYERAGELGDAAVSANEAGVAGERLGRLDDAAASYGRALRLAERAGFARGEATARSNLGRLASRRGDFASAADLLGGALPLWRSLGDSHHEAMVLNGLGVVHTAVGEPAEGAEAHRRALRLLQEPSGRFERIVAWTQLGHAELEAGRPGAALGYFTRALRMCRQLGEPRSEAVALNGLALAGYRAGRHGEAREPALQALHLFQALGDREGELASRINLGWIEAAAGRPERARGYLWKALSLARELGSRPALAACLYGLAWAERSRGDPRAALARIREAVETVEAVRGAAGRRDLQIPYFAAREDLDGFWIDLLMERHRREPGAGFDAQALAVSERSRSRTLLDLVWERIDRSGSRTDAGSTPPILPILDVAAIRRQVLDGETALLEYYLGEERSYLWVLTARSLASFELPPRGALDGPVRRTRTLLANSHRRGSRGPARLAASALSRALLPSGSLPPGCRRLLIVAHDVLQYLPFAALPAPAAATAAASGPVPPGDLRPPARRAGDWPEPLLARYEVVSTPSASVLALLRSRLRERPPGRGIGMLDDAVYGLPDERLVGRLDTSAPPGLAARDRLERLPSTAQEAAAILSLVPPDERFRATGFDATPELVKSGRLSGFAILHFAVHGWLDAVQPERSALELSRFDRAGRPRRSSRLWARDLYALDLRAHLVVLSACDTALGPEFRGEGLVGLPQGFFAAGAGRVEVSLWPVPDQTTARLMASFYRRLLREGRPPGEALRLAQAAIRREPGRSAPYYWAGFVLQGDWR